MYDLKLAAYIQTLAGHNDYSEQHWLSQTPTQFLNTYIRHECQTSENTDHVRRIRYLSFTIRAFVFRTKKLFLSNGNNNTTVSVPTERFDVVSLPDSDELPLFEVEEGSSHSIRDQIRLILSAKFKHPNILENARFMDEFSAIQPTIRRRVEASAIGSVGHHFLCDLELSIVLSKYDGSLGLGPTFRWITESEIADVEDRLRLTSGIDTAHLQIMFRRYEQCRKNQAFHERCSQAVRGSLEARWKVDDTPRTQRLGIVAHTCETDGIWVFTMTSQEAAMRKDVRYILYEGRVYQALGRFVENAVQLVPEVEIWSSIASEDGSVVLEWPTHPAKAYFY